MTMTGKERLTWLKQIDRIHKEVELKRQKELSEQLNYIMESNEQNRER